MQPHPLKTWMDAAGLRQEDVAAALGVDQTYISKILRGRRKPSREMASKLSKYTARKVTVDAILSYEAEYATQRPRGATAPPRDQGSEAAEAGKLRLVKAK